MQLLKISAVIVETIKGFAGVQSMICKSPNFHCVIYSSTKFSSQHIRTIMKPEEEETSQANIHSAHFQNYFAARINEKYLSQYSEDRKT